MVITWCQGTLVRPCFPNRVSIMRWTSCPPFRGPAPCRWRRWVLTNLFIRAWDDSSPSSQVWTGISMSNTLLCSPLPRGQLWCPPALPPKLTLLTVRCWRNLQFMQNLSLSKMFGWNRVHIPCSNKAQFLKLLWMSLYSILYCEILSNLQKCRFFFFLLMHVQKYYTSTGDYPYHYLLLHCHCSHGGYTGLLTLAP